MRMGRQMACTEALDMAFHGTMDGKHRFFVLHLDPNARISPYGTLPFELRSLSQQKRTHVIISSSMEDQEIPYSICDF